MICEQHVDEWASKSPRQNSGERAWAFHRPYQRRLPMLLAGLTLAAVYWFPVRRWFLQWGTTPEERERVMAGDAFIANPTLTSTQAVTVNAPPSAIWPWLVQLGYRRGGLYSYDWLDQLFGFLDRPSATNILSEFQDLAIGDKIFLGREEFTVSALEPNRALALSYKARGMEWVWQWDLYSLDDEHTRLVARSTERTPKTALYWLFMRVTEPAAFVMGSRMLLGLKERAERLQRGEAVTRGGDNQARSGGEPP